MLDNFTLEVSPFAGFLVVVSLCQRIFRPPVRSGGQASYIAQYMLNDTCSQLDAIPHGSLRLDFALSVLLPRNIPLYLMVLVLAPFPAMVSAQRPIPRLSLSVLLISY